MEEKPSLTTAAVQNTALNCLKCEKIYNFPPDDYLAHLFLEHRLVIADVDDIGILEDYLQEWEKKFKTHEIEEFCTTMLLDQLPDGTPAKNERYYLLSDILPQDCELRHKLQRKKLENALSQHQFERTDRTFSKECLYCRDVISGLRAEYLEHLFNKHFLQLGKPENLVYVDELLYKVQHNLESLICLYCEKLFKDRVTLKEHMRKKAHKRINPANHAYDRYFLINYKRDKENSKPPMHAQQRNRQLRQRQTNKNNSSQQHGVQTANDNESVDFEQRHRELVGGSNSDSDSEWSDWDGEASAPLRCLFCQQNEANLLQLKQHMISEHHNFDFDAQLKLLNFYQRIKAINYVRRQVRLLRCCSCDARFDTADLLLQHLGEEQHYGIGTQKQWDKPEFFFPTYEDDGLLCILDNDNEHENNDDGLNDTVVRIISEDTMAQVNKDAERLSLENFSF